MYILLEKQFNNGVIELPEDSRIIDAINTAGGVTENADLSKVNLAYILSDGCKVCIPNKNENLDSFVCVSLNPGEGVMENTQGIKVNINTATQSELETINGVGPSIAAKIIKYREDNGKYKTIEDLKNVGGIGEEKFNNLKDQVRVK